MMKKLGFLLALVLIAEGAMAEKVNTAYSNIAVAKVGTALNWDAKTDDKKADRKQVQALEENMTRLNSNLNSQLEKQASEKLLAKLAQQ